MARASSSPAARAVSAVACVALVVAGLGAASRLSNSTERAPRAAKVLPLRLSEVQRVVIESGAGRVELTRQADGSWSGAYGSPPGSDALMSDVDDRLLPLGSYRDLAADATDPGFGLVEPEITFRVEDRGGQDRAVLLGAPTFTGGGVYARRDDDAGRIYLVPRRMMDDLRSLVAGRRIDAPDDLVAKIDEFRHVQEEENAKPSGWLEQVLEAGVPLPEGIE